MFYSYWKCGVFVSAYIAVIACITITDISSNKWKVEVETVEKDFIFFKYNAKASIMGISVIQTNWKWVRCMQDSVIPTRQFVLDVTLYYYSSFVRGQSVWECFSRCLYFEGCYTLLLQFPSVLLNRRNILINWTHNINFINNNKGFHKQLKEDFCTFRVVLSIWKYSGKELYLTQRFKKVYCCIYQ